MTLTQNRPGPTGGTDLTDLIDRFAGPVGTALPRLTAAETAMVEAEMAELRASDRSGPPMEALRRVARAVPARLYEDSAEVLLRMHEIAGAGNLQSNLSSLATVRACFDRGLAGDDDEAPALIVGRGHIAPAFYAERYVRGELPFFPLTTLHQDGLTGVVHRDWGFRNTMRYSLGVGPAQAVSLALEFKRRGDDRKVVCLSGDGEMHEGVVFECLRFAAEAGLDNLVLVVDANGKGIEPLRRDVNMGYLAAYLTSVQDVDGLDADVIGKALDVALNEPGPSGIVCRTRKEGHSFKPPGAAPAVKPFAGTTGAMLASLRESTGRDMVAFTADMAARFGLDAIPYENVGLAESLSVGLTLHVPDDTVKVVATDAMYYMDSLSMLTEATTSVRNLMILAGRSYGAWGSAANAANLLALIAGTRVYEPITAAEFAACAARLLADPDTTHVLSMMDARFAPPAIDCAADVDNGVWMTAPAGDRDTVVVSFGYASILTSAATAGYPVPHLHCAALRPELDADLVRQLRSFRRIVSVEYNAVAGGFGEWLRSAHLLPVEVHGITGDIHTCAHDGQLRRQGMAPEQLAALLGRG